MTDVQLRDVTESDLPIFFEQQRDPAANHMAAFTAKDPTDREVFDAHWKRILNDQAVTIKTIIYDGHVAGSVASYTDNSFGKPEVTYWIGREYWGKGVATQALSKFLAYLKTRPIYARTAKDNAASFRVLEKCGFKLVGHDKGYANARREKVEELILELKGTLAQ